MKKNNKMIVSAFSLSLLNSVAFSSSGQNSTSMQIDDAEILLCETAVPANSILIEEPTPQVTAHSFISIGDLNGLKELLLTACGRAIDLDHKIERIIIDNYNGAETAITINETLLYCACANGHTNIVDFLINEKKVKTSIYDGFSPLYIAYKNKHYRIAELLLQASLNRPFQVVPKNPVLAVPAANPFAAQPVTPTMFQSSHIVDEAIYDACVDGELSVLEKILSSDCGKDRNLNTKVEKHIFVKAKHDITEETMLYAACSNGHENIVEFLINRKVNIETPDRNGWSPILIASKKGYTKKETLVEAKDNKDNTKIVKLLIDAVVPKGEETLVEAKRNFVNSQNNNNMTPLNIASYQGFANIVELLIKNGADVNMGDKLGARPLHVCLQKKHLTILKKLLSAPDIDVSVQTESGITPIYVAAFAGYTEMLEIMIDKIKEQEKSFYTLDNVEAEFNKIRNQQGLARKIEMLEESFTKKTDLIETIDLPNNDGLTPLIAAASNDNLDCVKLLYKNGANIHAVEQNKVSALFAATQNGHLSIVEFLFEKGASITTPIENNQFPLHSASVENRFLVAKFLLDNLKEADVNAQTIDGATALHMACEKKYTDMALLLLEKYNADYSIPTKHGFTALTIAAHHGCEEIVQSIIDAMIRDKKTNLINAASTGEPTALFIASQNGYDKIVEKILNVRVKGIRAVEVDKPTAEGETALFVAAYHDHTKIVKLLIANEANIDARDGNDRTAIWWATKNNKIKTVDILIKAGANLNIIDRQGNTELHIACQFGCIDTAIFLIENGAKQNLTNGEGKIAYQLLSAENQINFDAKVRQNAVFS